MKWIITGGAGFIGVNTACSLLTKGDEIVIVENLSRKGTAENLAWLRTQGQIEFMECDIRNADDLSSVFLSHRDAGAILHLAAQVAVTTSVTDPRTDFEINALGTFNALEALRKHIPEAAFLYASTNKVYGSMDDLRVTEQNGRYAYTDRPEGVAEDYPLDFHSPYGCSKGAGDQYVIDYARIYDLKTVSLRQSCIYGPHQFGVEDQGWVAWFTIASVLGRPLSVYGDGKQVRDLLHVEDLVRCYTSAVGNIENCKGKAYNIGGGTSNVLSLLELLDHLQELIGSEIPFKYDDWRPGDQRVFVSDISKAEKELQWKPRISVREGVEELYKWVQDNKSTLELVLGGQT